MTFFAILKLFLADLPTEGLPFLLLPGGKSMKIRFYTNNKEAIVFDLEDIFEAAQH